MNPHSPPAEVPVSYRPPLDDIRFLFEVFGYDRQLGAIERFASFDLDTSMTLLGEYAKYCADVLAPLNAVGDHQGVRYDAATKSVTTPDGFREAFHGFRDAGYLTLPWNPEHGGMGAPMALHTLAGEILIGANKSFSMCSGLTTGLIEALEEFGTDEQKHGVPAQAHLRRVVGHHVPHRAPVRHRPRPAHHHRRAPDGDGSYRLTGTKIWITFGEHDLAENIVHLVLARLPDAPRASRASAPSSCRSSSRRQPQPMFCGGTDHKMGIHASPTCVINLEGAKGWLVGEPHKGMRSMFVMMNAARLNVGIEGVALGEAAYQAALAFAKDRRQSRSLNPAKQEAKAGRQHPRAPRRAPHAARGQVHHGGPARARDVGGAGLRRVPPRRRGDPPAAQGRPARPAHADHQELRLGARLPQRERGHAGDGRRRLHPGLAGRAVPARRAHRDDLRGHQPHPGARPGRPQAADARRPPAAAASPTRSPR
jgi:alkylation response protein AidB-like acyl-CoA dehydrogenase